MKSNFKTLLLSLIIVLSVCVSMTILVSAEDTAADYATDTETQIEAVFEYSVSNSKVFISGLNDDFAGDLVIPAYIDGYPVYSISSNAFKNHTGIKRVTFESAVNVGSSAFSGCTSLESAVFADGIKSLDVSCFYGCTALTNVVLPETLTTIEYNCFNSCTSLAYIEFPESLTKIGSDAFKNCTSLSQVHIPKNVSTLHVDAFSGCTSIAELTVDEENTYFYADEHGIVYSADNTSINYFPNDFAAAEYAFPEGLTKIPDNLLKNNQTLTTVTLPSSLTSIGSNAFYGSVIETVILPSDSKLESIGTWAFRETPLQSIDLPDTVKSIGQYAFYSTAIQSINLSKNITFVGMYAFSRTNLTEVKINSDCKTWDSSCFSDAVSLEKVTLCDEVSGIPIGMFSGCTHLEAVYGGKNIVSVANSAFSDCTLLSYIELGENVETIGNAAFFKCSSLSVFPFKDKIISIDTYAFTDCTSMAGELVLPESLVTLKSAAFWGCSGITSIIFPESITEIKSTTFYNCSSLTEITVPGNIKTLEDGCFSSCGLKKVILEEGVETIGKSAFTDNSELEEIQLPDSLISIGEMAFMNHNCSSIVIPENVESIGADAFVSSKAYDVYFLSYNCVLPWESESTSDYCPFSGVTYDVNVYGYSGSTVEAYLSDCPDADEQYHAHTFIDLCSVNMHAPVTECAFETVCKYCSETISGHEDENSDGLCDNCTLSVSVEQDISIEYVNGVLTVYGTELIKGNFADIFADISDECRTIVFADGFESVGNAVFADFSSLEFIYIPESMKNIGADAFSGCISLESVIIMSDNIIIKDAFDDSAFDMFVVSDLADIPDSVNVVYTSFENETLSFDGSVSADLYDLFDLTSLFSIYWSDIKKLYFTHFEAVDFTVFEYNTSDYVGLDQSVFDNVSFTLHAFVDGEYTQIAFDSMYDLFDNGYDGTFYLTVLTDNEDVVYDDTQISIADTFRQAWQRILNAIIQLLNKLFAFFRRK